MSPAKEDPLAKAKAEHDARIVLRTGTIVMVDTEALFVAYNPTNGTYAVDVQDGDKVTVVGDYM